MKVYDPPTQLMTDPSVHATVDHIIDMLNMIDIDGETMQYILEQVGMDGQMLKQLTNQHLMQLAKSLGGYKGN